MSKEDNLEKLTDKKKTILAEIKSVTSDMAEIASSMDQLDNEEVAEQLENCRNRLSALLRMREYVLGEDGNRWCLEHSLLSDLKMADIDISEFPEPQKKVEVHIDKLRAQLEQADEPCVDGVWQWGNEEGDNNKAADFLELMDEIGPLGAQRFTDKLKDLDLSIYKKVMLLDRTGGVRDVDTLSKRLGMEREEAISLYFDYHLKTPYQEGEEGEGPARVDFLYSESSAEDRAVMDRKYEEAFHLLIEQGYVSQAAELFISYVQLDPDKAREIFPERERQPIESYLQKWLIETEEKVKAFDDEDPDWGVSAVYRAEIEKVKSFLGL